MQDKYLLDTNAYFNCLRYTVLSSGDINQAVFKKNIEKIKEGSCYISELSRIEIISVVGKYARGVSGGKTKCNCIISGDGTVCSNYRYTTARKPMKTRLVANWLKLIEETVTGSSSILTVEVLPLSDDVLREARRIVKHALKHNFGSVDAMIAAALYEERKKEGRSEMKMITSDKALKACLDSCDLPYWDAFDRSKITVG